jgi:hypothetical protein
MWGLPVDDLAGGGHLGWQGVAGIGVRGGSLAPARCRRSGTTITFEARRCDHPRGSKARAWVSCWPTPRGRQSGRRPTAPRPACGQIRDMGFSDRRARCYSSDLWFYAANMSATLASGPRTRRPRDRVRGGAVAASLAGARRARVLCRATRHRSTWPARSGRPGSRAHCERSHPGAPGRVCSPGDNRLATNSSIGPRLGAHDADQPRRRRAPLRAVRLADVRCADGAMDTLWRDQMAPSAHCGTSSRAFEATRRCQKFLGQPAIAATALLCCLLAADDGCPLAVS